MSLARIKTWNAGDVLTAADLNAEFNNPLNNPISLISPTTGAINFDLKSHTNLVPSAISATSGSDSDVLTVSTGTTIWKAGGVSNPTVVLSAGAAVFSTANFPQLLKSTAINQPALALAYDSATVEEAYFQFPLSTKVSAVSSASIDLWYFATSSGGTTVWQVGTQAIITGSSGGGKSTSVSSTQTYGAVGELKKVSIALVGSSWATPCVVQVRIDRLATDAGDGSTGDAYVTDAALRITV